MSAVTVPEDKLIELQRKAKLVDVLVEALDYFLTVVEEPPSSNCSCHISPPCGDCEEYGALREAFADARKAISKAKGQSCSTLCHPEEPCSITENGKCKAKGE